MGKIVSVYENFRWRTASRNELNSRTEVPLYSKLDFPMVCCSNTSPMTPVLQMHDSEHYRLVDKVINIVMNKVTAL
jgi:hypothetical protein